MNRLLAYLGRKRRKILIIAVLTPAYAGLFFMWEILGMYTDTQALATGSFTLILFEIGAAFSLGIGTLGVNNPNFTGRQLSFQSPPLRFFGGGFLMMWNIFVPQYYAIPESTASLVTRLWFNTELGLGAIGLFLFLSGFLQIFINMVKGKIDPANKAPTFLSDQLPYRLFPYLLRSR
ncbi:MAG TPA: hypothetical protein VGS11_04245 [Candidatus Bathyarchaeia archaeon]|nr:hypothetical protein [Candidatus Bathyarchaeia archaeon]